jgi:Na+/H+ antiporter NhaC
MKNMKALLSLPLFIMFLLFSSFSPRQEQRAQPTIVNYAWYTPSGQFVAWSTLANALIVSDATTDPTNGTLVALGYTDGGPGLPPSGTLVYKIYTHP